MHAVDLISSVLVDKEPLPCEPRMNVCALTGEEVPCVPRQLLLGGSFTTQSVLRAPTSEWIGVNAWIALKHKWERMACWVATAKEFRVVKRAEIRTMVLEGCEVTPWAGWITTSYKKHGALLAPVNAAPRGVWAFDERLCDARDADIVAGLWARLRAFQDAGISRPMMESGECPPGLIGKIGLQTWSAFLDYIRPHKSGGLYTLIVYLLPSREELTCKP